MGASPMALMDWQIPRVRHTYSRRDTAFYALSLGVGADSTDMQQLALVDPWHADMQALPSMALVLAYPGFWLGAPGVEQASGVAPWQVLHVEQSVQLTAPLPPEGDVESETRVTAIVDKGAERGSLLYSERRIHAVGTGDLIARCEQVHFLRQAGGFGSAGLPPLAAPEAALLMSDKLVRKDTPTQTQQALVYRLNGDTNALHFDPEVARKAGFQRPILHGMCTVGIAVSAVMGELQGHDARKVRGFSVRMSSPVLPGDTLRHEIASDGRFQTRVLGADKLALTAGRVDWHG